MKYVIFLADGMADEPIESLGGRTPVMAAHTPNFDRLAARGRLGTFLSLPDAFPTSSDVANLSVLGYDLATCYQGRGPLEAASQGIVLEPDEIAMRVNLVTASEDGVLVDYSGGQVSSEEAGELIAALQEAFGSNEIRFHKGVKYRNLLILKGARFSADFSYEKPDDHPGDPYGDLLPRARGPESEETVALARRIIRESVPLLTAHPVNRARRARGERMANMAWPWSPGRKPAMRPFQEIYGKTGAIISAVDVIKGIGVLGRMEVIEVAGTTGYLDTNYEGKALAAVEALERNDFVYLHVEAIDEVSHEGDLDKKLKAIEDFDKRLVGTFLDAFEAKFGLWDNFSCALLPDHPVPIHLRKHTRTPIPALFVHPGATPDRAPDGSALFYNERDALLGSVGPLKGDGVMRRLFGMK